MNLVKGTRISGIILGGLLFLACVARFPTHNFKAEMEIFFRIASFVALTFLLAGNRKILSGDWWVMAFYLLSLFSLFYPVGMSDIGFKSFVNIQYGLIWYMAVSNSVSEDEMHWILDFICLIAIVNVAYQYLQLHHLDFIFVPIHDPRNTDYNPLYGLMAQRNHLSSMLAECFPAFLRKGRWLGIPIVLLGLYWAESMGGPAAIAVGLIFFWIINSHRISNWSVYLFRSICSKLNVNDLPVVEKFIKIVVYIFPFILTAAFYQILPRMITRAADAGGRLRAWKNAWPYYRKMWWSGWGLGNWKVVFAQRPLTGKELWWSTAHNDPYQGLFEMGPAFPIILAGYLVSAFRMAWKVGLVQVAVPLTAMVIILANSQVNFLMHIASTAMVAMTWMGVLKVMARKKDCGNN